MKFVCLGYIEPGKFEGLPDSERNALVDGCFAYDDVLRRNGHFAMSRGYGSLAYDERPAIHTLDPEQMESPNGADDVENRVDGTHLVQVDLFERRSVNLRFDLRQGQKNRVSTFLHGSRRVALLDDRANVLEVTPVRLRGMAMQAGSWWTATPPRRTWPRGCCW